MSQAKVDKKKELKKNRQKVMSQQKRDTFMAYAIVVAIAAIIVGFVGFYAYKSISAYVEANKPMQYNEVDIAALEDYLTDLNK